MSNKILRPLTELDSKYRGIWVKPDKSEHSVFAVFLQKGQTVNFYDLDTHKELSINLEVVNKLGVIEGLLQKEFYNVEPYNTEKQKIKQKYEDVANLIIERTLYLLNNNDDFKPLNKVHLIEADIKYFLDKVEEEIRVELQKELNKYSNPHIRHENQI